MKQQFVVTHTIRQNEILPIQDSLVTNTPSVEMLLTHTHTHTHTHKVSPHIFVKGNTLSCWYIEDRSNVFRILHNYDILLFHERYVFLTLIHTTQMKFFVSAHVYVNKIGQPRLGPKIFISRTGLVFFFLVNIL